MNMMNSVLKPYKMVVSYAFISVYMFQPFISQTGKWYKNGATDCESHNLDKYKLACILTN